MSRAIREFQFENPAGEVMHFHPYSLQNNYVTKTAAIAFCRSNIAFPPLIWLHCGQYELATLVLVSRCSFIPNQMLTGMLVQAFKIILQIQKGAKHTGREKNTCKHTASHTPPTMINTFWQSQPKASIIVLTLQPGILSFVYWWIQERVGSRSTWSAVADEKLQRGGNGHFGKSKTAV